ncbi:hypothetical protein [Nitrospirillum iridis]|uniref:Lipoprotein n=1 Tax=Nitrospirillum iridis TaxID=765888 RepID=A0A7X0EEM0_9PROT|nr:hypothetical protein [Nitrospirillum iridis]MBB6251564.1 hypothetical protein [Nitrospirillum iridis]
MRKVFGLLGLLVLAACQGAPNHTFLRPHSDIPSAKAGTGTVILGLTVQQYGKDRLGITSGQMLVHVTPLLPPKDGREFLGTEHFEVQFICSVLDERPCRETGGVRVFQLPPGRYALSGVEASGYDDGTETHQNFFLMATYPWVKSTYTPTGYVVAREYSKDSFANADTPTFTVEEGKVVYIGSMIVEFGRRLEMRYKMAADNASVQELLSSPDAAARSVVRLVIWNGNTDEKVARTGEGLK